MQSKTMHNKLTLNTSLMRATSMSLLVFGLSSGALAQEQAATETQATDGSETVEIIEVTGIRRSLSDAIMAKRAADQIMDAISAEDIGKLPDDNVAEAMQRITGVQIGRTDDGSGGNFQVRGLSQNRVEINGRSVVGTGSDNRVNAFNTTSSSLFKGIEVIKSPTADMVEGAIGATVRLNTFQPLDFKNPTISAAVEGTQDSLHDDAGYAAKGFVTDKWELDGDGEIGVLLNVFAEERNVQVEGMAVDWRAAHNNQDRNLPADHVFEPNEFLVYSPRQANVENRPYTIDKKGLDLTFQWQVNDSLELYSNTTYQEFERARSQARLIMFAENGQARYQSVDDYQIDLFERQAREGEFFDQNGTPAEGTLQRGIIYAGRLAFPGGAPGRAAANFEIIEETQIAQGLGANWQINDSLLMEAEYALSKSDWYRDNLNTSYNVGVRNLFLVPDPDNPGQMMESGLNPDVVFDLTDATEMGQYYFDMEKFANELGIPAEEATLANVDLFNWNNFSGLLTDRNTQEQSFKLDFSYFIDGDHLSGIKFGGRWAEFTTDREESRLQGAGWNNHSIRSGAYLNSDGIDWNGNGNDTDGNRTDLVLINEDLDGLADRFFRPTGDFLTDFSGQVTTGFIEPVYDRGLWTEVLDTYFPGFENESRTVLPWRWEPNLTYPYDITEETQAVYFMADFDGTLFGLPYSANAGVRVVKTEVTADGYGEDFVIDSEGYYYADRNDIDAEEARAAAAGELPNPANIPRTEAGAVDAQLVAVVTRRSVENDYTNVLPSANINLNVAENMFVRFAYAETITRPDPGDLAPARSIPQGGGGTGNEGNPNLEPLKAKQFDVSWEWYLDEITSISAAYFHKELEDFLQTEFFTLQSKSDTDDDDIVTIGSDLVSMRREINGGDGTVDGIELAYQTQFSSLPAPFDGLGMVANYTYTDSSQKSGFNELTGSALPVPGLSENSYNLILFYEKNGWSFRAAYNYRDSFYDGDSLGVTDPQLYTQDPGALALGQEQYIAYSPTIPVFKDAIGRLDLSMSYTFENNLRIYAQAQNANVETEYSYVGIQDETKYARSFSNIGSLYKLGISWRGNMF
ncbi:TonB-dependent receptor [Alteromonas aestuariivivens]|uniref:TonB-dependent receptor n=1 Tax=Alteromonas aestuariivivens TaxID=1938339 RepID=A0A3D8MEY5_9ALTE|nr:TonB-dependent receptor [Alteromonas aestuariivivens]RDV29367.1 TonB-dependent receptor [Alteromonas aestuariivivens]